MYMRASAKTLLLAAATAVLTIAGVAYAGYVNRSAVVIGANYMSGTTYGARNSSNTTEYIKCYVSGFSVGNAQVGCSARDAAGAFKSCTTYSPSIAQAATGISSYSRILVYFSGAECTQLTVTNGSEYLP